MVRSGQTFKGGLTIVEPAIVKRYMILLVVLRINDNYIVVIQCHFTYTEDHSCNEYSLINNKKKTYIYI